MSNPGEFEARLSAVETRLEHVAADAAATRHLAAARDRDLADLTIKVDANRSAINALGVQTAGRFDQVDTRFDRVDARFDRLERRVDDGFAEMRARFAQVDATFDLVDNGFAAMRAKFDQTAAGMQMIVELLTRAEDQ